MTTRSKYVKPKRISLKSHPELNEKWVQELISEDPGIIGLGDLVLRDIERLQPKAGRLDLLLQDSETKRRYEVEVQLGATDESHIIRTIEYWDIERKRYPQYEHCAVIIAEDITSRFLNVISLFNGFIPLIAIQVQAYEINGSVTLIFTKVLDELALGLIDEDEEAESAPADRAYWENKSTKASVKLADDLLRMVSDLEPSLELKYNKFYIGLSLDGSAFNFVQFRPRKNQINLELKIPKTDDADTFIEDAGLEALEYQTRWGLYRLRLTQQDISKKSEAIKQLMKMAYDYRRSQ